ncbi:hypothetical protein GJAV_G00210290 [Gymnothorax javanicus]|nr:hypothetical protein GJAV_G00210290 [Gymnothorax javanicus]
MYGRRFSTPEYFTWYLNIKGACISKRWLQTWFHPPNLHDLISSPLNSFGLIYVFPGEGVPGEPETPIRQAQEVIRRNHLCSLSCLHIPQGQLDVGCVRLQEHSN